MMKRLTYGWLIALFVGIGCGGAEELSNDNERVQSRSFGLMSVNYTHDWQTDHNRNNQSLELTTTAQFVRYSAIEEKTIAKLLALPINPDRDLPTQGCKLYDLSIDLDEQGLVQNSDSEKEESPTVDLLEAGDLVVKAGSVNVKLSPRHFPGLLPFISGVVYGEVQSDQSENTSQIDIQSAGGSSVGSFNTNLMSPTLPQLTKISSQSPSQSIQISQNEAIELNWQSAEQTNADDIFYLQASFSAAKGEYALRCAIKDNGSYTLNSDNINKLSDGQNGKLTIDLIRLRRQIFTAQGLDTAELQVSARERISVNLR